MGILMALPEIIIEVAEVAAEAAAAAAEAAAEAAIDTAIDAGIEGAVDAAAEAGTSLRTDAALDAGLDAAIDGTADQIARTAGGQAMKKLVEKVGKDAAKRCVNQIKDQVKDNLKDQAKQDLKDFINGNKQPPPVPASIPDPPAPDGVDVSNLKIDVNGGQFVLAENYFKALHGAFITSRQNENVSQMIHFADMAAQVVAGMFNARNANQVVFRLINFDGDLGTSTYGDVLTAYNGMISKFDANQTDEEANAIVDPVKDDLQNKINTALANTYVAPAVATPDLSKYTALKYPLQDPNVYPTIEEALKNANTAFRNAFNVSNKTQMIEFALNMAEICRDGVAVRKFAQPAFDAVEVNAASATGDWLDIQKYWNSVQQNLNFQSNRDDLNRIVTGGLQNLDSVNNEINLMLAKTQKATPQQQQAAKQNAQKLAQAKQQAAQQPGGPPQQPGAPPGQQIVQPQQGPQSSELQAGQPPPQGSTPGPQAPSQTNFNTAAPGTTPSSATAQLATYAAGKIAPHAISAAAPHVLRAAPYIAGKATSYALSSMMPQSSSSGPNGATPTKPVGGNAQQQKATPATQPLAGQQAKVR